jgi:hypothetical protein
MIAERPRPKVRPGVDGNRNCDRVLRRTGERRT